MQNENLLSGHYEKEWGEQSREVTSLPLLDSVIFFRKNTFLKNL